MKKMDQKYGGSVYKIANGEVVPPDEWIVFRAKDLAVPYMLEAYAVRCSHLGCNPDHMKAISDLKMRVLEFQRQYPERCKVPD